MQDDVITPGSLQTLMLCRHAPERRLGKYIAYMT